jgi:hypothetical protein
VGAFGVEVGVYVEVAVHVDFRHLQISFLLMRVN